jgi:hypothetical protein
MGVLLEAAASGNNDSTWFDWAQVSAAVFAAAAAVTIPLTAYLRRPKLRLSTREAKRHSHVETNGPHLRLLVQNQSGRRTARGTRVMVVGHRREDAPDDWTSLAYPSLGWPSATGETEATEGEVTVYSGSGRPIGIGLFIHARRDREGRLNRVPGTDMIASYAANDPEGASWHLCLTLHKLDIYNDRDKLQPGEWVIRLLVGADDGDAEQFDVHVAWSEDAEDGSDVLAEALDRLKVKRVTRIARMLEGERTRPDDEV